MAESDALEGDVGDGSVGGAFHLEEGLQGRGFHRDGAQVFTWQWHIVEFLFLRVKIPLSGLVEQLFCIGEVEGGVVTVGVHHRRGPGVHEVYVALGVVEGDGGTVAGHFDVFDAEVCDAPHLMQHHLKVAGMEHVSDGLGWHVERLFALVHRQDAVHLLEV